MGGEKWARERCSDRSIKLGLDPPPSLPQPANTSQHLLLSSSYWATVLELPWLAGKAEVTILAFSNSNTILFHMFNVEKLLIHNKEKKLKIKPKQCKPEFFSFKLGFRFLPAVAK